MRIILNFIKHDQFWLCAHENTQYCLTKTHYVFPNYAILGTLYWTQETSYYAIIIILLLFNYFFIIELFWCVLDYTIFGYLLPYFSSQDDNGLLYHCRCLMRSSRVLASSKLQINITIQIVACPRIVTPLISPLFRYMGYQYLLIWFDKLWLKIEDNRCAAWVILSVQILMMWWFITRTFILRYFIFIIHFKSKIKAYGLYYIITIVILFIYTCPVWYYCFYLSLW